MKGDHKLGVWPKTSPMLTLSHQISCKYNMLYNAQNAVCNIYIPTHTQHLYKFSILQIAMDI